MGMVLLCLSIWSKNVENGGLGAQGSNVVGIGWLRHKHGAVA